MDDDATLGASDPEARTRYGDPVPIYIYIKEQFQQIEF